jgi:type I restriction enzyme R subunit
VTAQPKHTEIRFEDAIEFALLETGYAKGNPELFDAERGFFPAEVVAYISLSQPKKWQSLVDLQGAAAEPTLLDALVKELGSSGVLSVLRRGFKCFGKAFQMAAFQPASGMNPDAQAAYAQNILTVTRQVAFNPITVQTIDAVLPLPLCAMLPSPSRGEAH